MPRCRICDEPSPASDQILRSSFWGQSARVGHVGFNNSTAYCQGWVYPGNPGFCNAPSNFAGYSWVWPQQPAVVAYADVLGTPIGPAFGSQTFGFEGYYNNNGLAIMNASNIDRLVSIGVYDTGWNLLMWNQFTISAYSSTGRFIHELFPAETYGSLPDTFNVYVDADWYFGAVATDCSGSPCTVVAHN